VSKQVAAVVRWLRRVGGVGPAPGTRRWSVRLGALDVLLVALSMVAGLVMLTTNSDPLLLGVVTSPMLRSALLGLATGSQAAFELSGGFLSGVLMYYLVVRLPEWSKRHRLRTNLAVAYRLCKVECNIIYLGALMYAYPAELPVELLDRKTFRAFFNERHPDGQTRWDGVAHALDVGRIKALAVELELLREEIHFTLSVVDVEDLSAFSFFKSMSRAINRSKNWSTDYDGTKSLMGFMWSLHTGWDWNGGYVERDPMLLFIESI
jgi:hypothetical protein